MVENKKFFEDEVDHEEERPINKIYGCERLQAEWRLGMFSTIDADGRIVDMEAVFHPKPKLLAYSIKLAFFAWTIQVLVVAIRYFTLPILWIAYLTYWGTVLMILYFALSLMCLICPISQDPTNFLTRATWLVFTTTINLEVVIVFLYWVKGYEGGTPRYETIMQHGGFMLAIMFDGFVISRIPIRFKQVFGFFVMELLYIIWSGIHAATGIGNLKRKDSNPTTEDDALYSSINWVERPVDALIIAIGVLFVATPTIFIFTWSFSTWGRRYLRSEGGVTDVANGNGHSERGVKDVDNRNGHSEGGVEDVESGNGHSENGFADETTRHDEDDPRTVGL